MTKSPRRVDMSVLDDELKGLINASAKIFPMSESDIENNINPNNYEYGRIGRSIYVWHENKWDYVIADDIDIKFSDIKEKPTHYNPIAHSHDVAEVTNVYSKTEVDSKLSTKSNASHTHSELHEHSNKSILDTITQVLVDGWNSAVAHISDIVKHITSEERSLWNTVSSKADQTYVDDELLNKANVTHDHDGAYYKKSEVDTRLSGKSNTNHNHDLVYAVKDTEDLVDDIDFRLAMIEGGYSEGHAHTNLEDLSRIAYSGNKSVIDLKQIEDNTNAISNISFDWESMEGKPTEFPPSAHDHQMLYYSKEYLDSVLNAKANTDHVHDYASTTHTHTDKADKTYVDTELAKKADSTTVSGHTGNTTVHVTQTDKDNWNGKAEGSHTHQEYLTSLPTHSHSEYSLTSHTHAYAPTTHSHNNIGTLGNYVWQNNTAPRSFPLGLSVSFVRAETDGFPSYGSVMNISGYSNAQDGAVGQIYVPYSDSMGGNSFKIRKGNYNNAGWSPWYDLLHSGNHAHPKITVSATAPTSPSVNDIWIQL